MINFNTIIGKITIVFHCCVIFLLALIGFLPLIDNNRYPENFYITIPLGFGMALIYFYFSIWDYIKEK